MDRKRRNTCQGTPTHAPLWIGDFSLRIPHLTEILTYQRGTVLLTQYRNNMGEYYKFQKQIFKIRNIENYYIITL